MNQNIPKPSIKLVRGKTVEKSIVLEEGKEYLIGRAPQCPIRILDTSVSRQHARLWVEGTEVFLEDLGSVNGTFLNGNRVEKTARLKDGDVIQVGQRSLQTPILLLFDDPAGRLLSELGLEEQKVKDARNFEPVQQPAQKPDDKEEMVQQADEIRDKHDIAPHGKVETHKVAFEQTWVILLAGGVLVLILLSFFFLLPHFKKEKLILSAFKLNPSEVYAGSTLFAYSPDLVPGREYIVIIGDKSIKAKANEKKQLVLVVPELTEEKYLNHPLAVKIQNEDKITLAESTILYRIQPEIESIEPQEVHVGGKLKIFGKYLQTKSAPIKVSIGDKIAGVESSSQDELIVKVPVVTRDKPITLPLVLQFGTLTLEYEGKIRVLPREQNPIDLKFEPYLNEQTQIWFVQTRFGPLIPVPAGQGQNDSPPPEVLRVKDALQKVFSLAESQQSLRFVLQKNRSQYAILAQSPETDSRIMVVRWPEQFLRDLVTLYVVPVSEDIFPYWMTYVLNTYVEVFQRGRVPEQIKSPVISIFEKLVKNNYESGGTGRPEESDIVILKESDLKKLERFLFQVPQSFGRVEGNWQGTITNVFFPGQKYSAFVQLQLKQHGLNVSGALFLRFERGKIRIDIPSKRVTGKIQFGEVINIHLASHLSKPINSIVFDGVVEGNTMKGSCGMRHGKKCVFTLTRIQKSTAP